MLIVYVILLRDEGAFHILLSAKRIIMVLKSVSRNADDRSKHASDYLARRKSKIHF